MLAQRKHPEGVAALAVRFAPTEEVVSVGVGGKRSQELGARSWNGVGGWCRIRGRGQGGPCPSRLRLVHDAGDQIKMRLVAGFGDVGGTGHLGEQGGAFVIIAIGELSGETFYAGATRQG